jgi:hypothetical protein
MLRYEDVSMAWVTVPATALDVTAPLRIEPNQVSQAVFRFEVADGSIRFGEGQVVIDVDETGACPPGFSNCGDVCVDLQTSPG